MNNSIFRFEQRFWRLRPQSVETQKVPQSVEEEKDVACYGHGQFFLQQTLQLLLTYTLATPRDQCAPKDKLMLEEGLSAEVLEVSAFHPTFTHHLVCQIKSELQNSECRHQHRGQGRHCKAIAENLTTAAGEFADVDMDVRIFSYSWRVFQILKAAPVVQRHLP